MDTANSTPAAAVEQATTTPEAPEPKPPMEPEPEPEQFPSGTDASSTLAA